VITLTPTGLSLALDATPEGLRDELLNLWAEGAPGVELDPGGGGRVLLLSFDALDALSPALFAGLGLRRLERAVPLAEHAALGGARYTWVPSFPPGTRREGGWLHGPGGAAPALLPGPLRGVLDLADQLPGAPAPRALRIAQRAQRLAQGSPLVILPDRIARLKVRVVRRLRLDVEGPPEDPQPVICLQEQVGTPAEAPQIEEGWAPPVEAAPPLEEDAPPELLDGLGTISITEETAVRQSSGEYAVLSPGVARNLKVLHAVRRAPPAERRRFFENPAAYLPDEAAFDHADYSERVIGLDRAPKGAPAGGGAGRDWATPADGLLIEVDGRVVWVEAAEVAELHAAVVDAIARGQPRVPHAGVALPATPPIAEALARALPVERRLRLELPDGPLELLREQALELRAALVAARAERREYVDTLGRRAPATPEVERQLDGLLAGGGAERRRPVILKIQDNELQLAYAVDGGAPRPVLRPGLDLLRPGMELKPHQVEALAHLRGLWARGAKGALLCDDMGLGKTLQALCFAVWVARQARAQPPGGGPQLPVLVVGPPGLLEPWLRELQRWIGPDDLGRVLWGGDGAPDPGPGRQLHRLGPLLLDAPELPNAGTPEAAVVRPVRLDLAAVERLRPDVLFIGYDRLRSLQFALAALRVGVLVADEVQEAKNPNSLRSRALRAMNYDFGLGMTGTPIENSWDDLWTIADFAVPGRLGSLLEFRESYRPTVAVEDGGRRLGEALGEHLIRRTRAAALQGLPPCTLRPEPREMPPEQRLAWQAEQVRAGASGAAILGLLASLSLVCLHPRPRARPADRAGAVAWLRASARTSALLDTLDAWIAEGEAVLVFVRSRMVQDSLAVALPLALPIPPVEVFNGQRDMAERQALVGRFERAQGPRVLLVSPEVGGAGWNLQFAARSVLLERPYNPAVEDQVIARTWRLGQTRPVEVVAPMAVVDGARTFDEVLNELLEEKRALAQSVLSPVAVRDGELAARFGALFTTPA